MITIGFCNLKGGVGKTTACQNIAVALAKQGKKVAVVDMDPQSNLSAGFGIAPSPTDPQVFDLLSGGAKWDDIVRNKEGVDIIPSSLNLVMAELNQDGPLGNNTALREALNEIEPGRYDYMLLDSPPQLGIFTRNVLAACNKIIVPMDGGFYSLFGLRLLDSSLPVLSERLGNKLEIMGILMTNYNPRLYIARKIFEEVKNNFSGILFESYVRQCVSLIEAASMGMSIFAYSPKSKGAEFYNEVTAEFLKRLEGNENFPEAPSKEQTEIQNDQPEEITEKIEIEPQEITVKVPEVPKEKEQEIKIDAPIPEPVMTQTAGAYEESIKQEILEMLPERAKKMWANMLAPVTDITRSEIDVKALRDDFDECDKDRFTFYILNDESDTFWPVMYSDQIVEPFQCLIKWDERGSAEVYM